jgi:hypothetical protein
MTLTKHHSCRYGGGTRRFPTCSHSGGVGLCYDMYDTMLLAVLHALRLQRHQRPTMKSMNRNNTDSMMQILSLQDPTNTKPWLLALSTNFTVGFNVPNSGDALDDPLDGTNIHESSTMLQPIAKSIYCLCEYSHHEHLRK